MIAYVEPLYQQSTRPSCGSYYSSTNDGTWVVSWRGSDYAGSTWHQAPEPIEDGGPEVRLAEKRAISRAAVLRARLALQRALDDPRPEIPPGARKRPYRRPAVKGRVCAGSSRYRVLVN